MITQNSKLLILIVSLTLVITLGACGITPAPTSKPEIPGLPATLAVQTIAARAELAGLLSSPTPIPELSEPEALDTPTPSSLAAPMHTLAPTNTMLPMLTSVYAASFSDSPDTCFNAAEFVKDISFPDNSFIKPRQKFTKIWQLRNIGTCTWESEYLIIYVWGNQMAGESPTLLGQTVDPGSVVDIALDLIAPTTPGSYQGDWMLQGLNGDRFGTGYKGREHFWVAINVGVPGVPEFPSFCVGGR